MYSDGFIYVRQVTTTDVVKCIEGKGHIYDTAGAVIFWEENMVNTEQCLDCCDIDIYCIPVYTITRLHTHRDCFISLFLRYFYKISDVSKLSSYN